MSGSLLMDRDIKRGGNHRELLATEMTNWVEGRKFKNLNLILQSDTVCLFWGLFGGVSGSSAGCLEVDDMPMNTGDYS